MTNTVVRARIDEHVKEEAAAVLAHPVGRISTHDGTDCERQGLAVRAANAERRDDRSHEGRPARRADDRREPR